MTDESIRVLCSLTDCTYYCNNKYDPEHAYCNHPDKQHYMNGLTCPLYRLDVTKKMANLQAQLEKKRKDKEG